MCFCFLPPSGVNQGDAFHVTAESLPLRTASWESPLGPVSTPLTHCVRLFQFGFTNAT